MESNRKGEKRDREKETQADKQRERERKRKGMRYRYILLHKIIIYNYVSSTTNNFYCVLCLLTDIST